MARRIPHSRAVQREQLHLEESSLYFVGNATTLIRLGGFTILTDPNFIHRHEHVSIGYGMTAQRLRDPAIDIDDLPPIDLILLSHFHGDHFDQVAEARLDKDIPIVTTHEAAEQLSKRGFRELRPLNRWEHIGFERGNTRLIVTATPARHGPPVVSLALPDVMGSILEFESPDPTPRIYISGDTLMYDDIEEIPRRYPDIDVGLLHLGGTRVMGILVTADDDHGTRLMQTVNPRLVVPVHFDDYDVFASPIEDFGRAIRRAGWGDRVRMVERGQSLTLVREQ